MSLLDIQVPSNNGTGLLEPSLQNTISNNRMKDLNSQQENLMNSTFFKEQTNIHYKNDEKSITPSNQMPTIDHQNQEAQKQPKFTRKRHKKRSAKSQHIYEYSKIASIYYNPQQPTSDSRLQYKHSNTSNLEKSTATPHTSTLNTKLRHTTHTPPITTATTQHRSYSPNLPSTSKTHSVSQPPQLRSYRKQEHKESKQKYNLNGTTLLLNQYLMQMDDTSYNTPSQRSKSPYTPQQGNTIDRSHSPLNDQQQQIEQQRSRIAQLRKYSKPSVSPVDLEREFSQQCPLTSKMLSRQRDTSNTPDNKMISPNAHSFFMVSAQNKFLKQEKMDTQPTESTNTKQKRIKNLQPIYLLDQGSSAQKNSRKQQPIKRDNRKIEKKDIDIIPPPTTQKPYDVRTLQTKSNTKTLNLSSRGQSRNTTPERGGGSGFPLNKSNNKIAAGAVGTTSQNNNSKNTPNTIGPLQANNSTPSQPLPQHQLSSSNPLSNTTTTKVRDIRLSDAKRHSSISPIKRNLSEIEKIFGTDEDSQFRVSYSNSLTVNNVKTIPQQTQNTQDSPSPVSRFSPERQSDAAAATQQDSNGFNNNSSSLLTKNPSGVTANETPDGIKRFSRNMQQINLDISSNISLTDKTFNTEQQKIVNDNRPNSSLGFVRKNSKLRKGSRDDVDKTPTLKKFNKTFSDHFSNDGSKYSGPQGKMYVSLQDVDQNGINAVFSINRKHTHDQSPYKVTTMNNMPLEEIVSQPTEISQHDEITKQLEREAMVKRVIPSALPFSKHKKLKDKEKADDIFNRYMQDQKLKSQISEIKQEMKKKKKGPKTKKVVSFNQQAPQVEEVAQDKIVEEQQ